MQNDIGEQQQAARHATYQLIDAIGRVVVGLPQVTRRIVMGLLADGQVKPDKSVCGHILIEAVPGTAKTLLSETLASLLHLSFSRIQMDVDKRPGDILGYYDLQPEQQTLAFRPGPIFANIVLIDELNRARPEVKGALLQAMAEREVSIDTTTYALDEPFFIMANQNPIEQEGTYPLIEAELDRFAAKLRIDYLSPQQETDMLQRVGIDHFKCLDNMSDSVFPEERDELNVGRDLHEASTPSPMPLDAPQLIELRQTIREHTYVDPSVLQYAVDLVRATRPEDPLHAACLADLMLDGRSLIQLGASPRASLFLLNFAKVEAFLGRNRDQPPRRHVIPADIAAVAIDVLNHRLILDEWLVHRLLGTQPIPYLNAALRQDGSRIMQHRDDLVRQVLRRILRGVRLP